MRLGKEGALSLPIPRAFFAFLSTERLSPLSWSLEQAIGDYAFKAKNMCSSERNFLRLRPDRTSIFSKQKNILIPIVYLLLTALVSQEALSVFLRFKSITNTHFGDCYFGNYLDVWSAAECPPDCSEKKLDKTQIKTISRTIDQI